MSNTFMLHECLSFHLGKYLPAYSALEVLFYADDYVLMLGNTLVPKMIVSMHQKGLKDPALNYTMSARARALRERPKYVHWIQEKITIRT